MRNEHKLDQREFLKRTIAALGVTREGLAQRIGVSVKTINKWMSPKESDDFRVMPKMAEYYINDIILRTANVSCNTPNGGIKFNQDIHTKGSKMHLRQRILDAVLDGELGAGVVVTRQQVIAHFQDVSESYTGVVLSNAEMDTGTHSPTWEHYTHRIGRGVYRISPTALAQRLRERQEAGAQSAHTAYLDPTDDAEEAMDQGFHASIDDPRT